MAPADSGRDTAARGRSLLADRIEAAPAAIARIALEQPGLSALAREGPRAWVATGIGTSEGHARHFCEVASRFLGWPARFASTGSLLERPPASARLDWLVVFSQGLSANARHALTHLDAWAGVLLVTGLQPESTLEEGLSDEKRDFLAALDANGVVRIDLGCGAEYGSLLRVIGARAGYVAGWSILRTLARARLEDATPLDLDEEALLRAQRGAAVSLARAFPEDEPVAPFFASDRTLLLVSEGGVLDLVDQLTLKLAEGMLRPQPRGVDALHFAHGPLQAIAKRPASILYLASGAAGPGGDGPWLERFRATLDPALHDLRVIHADLPWPQAAVELEAIFDVLIARALDETGVDLVAWPGADREAPLYDAGPAPLGALPEGGGARVHYESRVWPEVEALIASGRRTALVGLGSIEQHGPHLPLGTDRWIAEALLAGLETRLSDAIAIPALAIGCASEHLDFAGTLHVEPATLEATLRDLLLSLGRHGFERAFLFTAHGGNLDALDDIGARLRDAVRPLELRVETDQRVGAMQSAVVGAAALSPHSAGPHAGEYETSVVAHLRPGAVRREALAPGRIVSPGESQGLFYPSLRPNTESGVLGDPSRAAAGRGAAYLDAWVTLLERGYRAAFPDESGEQKNRA